MNFPLTTSQAGINPHAAQPTTHAALGKSLWCNRQLIVQMTKREVVGRYKGSSLGLGIYTLAATVVAWAGYAWFQKTRRGFADVL